MKPDPPNTRPGQKPVERSVEVSWFNVAAGRGREHLRDARAETQEQTATALNALAYNRGEVTGITGNRVSRWERGIVHPSRFHCQLLAEHFGVTVAELGLTRQCGLPTERAGSGSTPSELLSIEDDSDMHDPNVTASQQGWLHIRRSLNAHHVRLAQTASQLYPESLRLGNTGLITRPDWLWQQPIDLADVTLSMSPTDEPATLDGTEDQTAHVRPLRVPGIRYQRYSQAIRDVAQPRLFENRPCWRLLDA